MNDLATILPEAAILKGCACTHARRRWCVHTCGRCQTWDKTPTDTKSQCTAAHLAEPARRETFSRCKMRWKEVHYLIKT